MSNRFDIVPSPLPELMALVRQPLSDSRGWFERMFCLNELGELVNGRSIVQINRSSTQKKGSVRGMHFQYSPSTEMKFISCVRGEVYDVAIDLRPESMTFLKWHAEILSAENYKTLAIPEGFAHGFQTLTDNCEMLYLHTAAHDIAAEGGLNPHDPSLNIAWPLPISEISARDANFPFITADFSGVKP